MHILREKKIPIQANGIFYIFLQKRRLEKNTIANANLLISTTKLINEEEDEEHIRFGLKTQQKSISRKRNLINQKRSRSKIEIYYTKRDNLDPL